MNIQEERHKIEWKKICKFSFIEQYDESTLGSKGGVYFWLFTKERKRIIYIGTATGRGGFLNRLRTEFEQLKYGIAYIVKPNRSYTDIYEFLKFDPYNKATKSLEPLLKETIWVPSNQNDTLRFNGEWKNFVENNYLNNLEIYVAETSVDSKILHAKCLESQMQVFFKMRNNLGYYTRGRGIKRMQSWLGRPEIRLSNLLDFKFTISNGLGDIWHELDSPIDKHENIDNEFYKYLDSIVKQNS